MGVAVLEVLASHCPSIRSIKLLSSSITAVGSSRASTRQASPPQQPAAAQRQILNHHTASLLSTSILAKFPRLVRLHVEDAHHLSHARDWLALPPSLEEVCCFALPNGLSSWAARGLKLRALRTLKLQDACGFCWNVKDLSALLKAAPSLRLLACVSSHTDTVRVRCLTMGDVGGMQQVHLDLKDEQTENEGVLFYCEHTCLESGIRVPIERVLSQLPCFPSVATCQLYGSSSSTACLSQLSRVFPNMAHLVCNGFTHAHLLGLSSCTHLKELVVYTSSEPHWAQSLTQGLVGLILCSPGLDMIDHPFRDGAHTAELQAMLLAAYTARASGLGNPSLNPGVWTVRSSSHGEGRTAWVRKCPFKCMF